MNNLETVFCVYVCFSITSVILIEQILFKCNKLKIGIFSTSVFQLFLPTIANQFADDKWQFEFSCKIVWCVAYKKNKFKKKTKFWAILFPIIDLTRRLYQFQTMKFNMQQKKQKQKIDFKYEVSHWLTAKIMLWASSRMR